MPEIDQDELQVMRALADNALEHLDGGRTDEARADIRHLRDCL